MKPILRTILGGVAALSAACAFAQAQQSSLTKEMTLTQKLGAYVPKDAHFKDESGKDVTFGDMFQGRPVVLVPIFFTCKTMCVVITDSLVQTVAKATRFDELKPGRDFDVVMLSINPKETPDLALAKKMEIFNLMTPSKQGGGENVEWRKTASNGWHLLTGSIDQVRAVTNAVGFKYFYNPETDLINHPSASMILTPQGQVSSYVVGTEFPTKVMETGLALARKNEIGVLADQSFMFGCIRMDPTTGKYTADVENILRAACVLTLIILFGSILGMALKERRKAKLVGGEAALR